MKNTSRFFGRSNYVKVFLSIVLVVAMITSSLPIAYAVTTTDSGKLGNTNFENGTEPWSKAYGDVKVNDITEGEATNKALELTADNNAVYQTVTRGKDKEYPKGTIFKWSLMYKSTDSNDIGALVLGLNEPTATAEQNDQLRQMMTWLKEKRKIDTKIPASGQYTVVVYSKPFNEKEDGKFEVDENDTYKDNFSLVPKINCTEKFTVTLFRTKGTDWQEVRKPDNDKFTFNENFPSLYYSLISYSGSPLVDDVDLTIMYDSSGKDENNNLRNGSFENPTIPSSFYYQPDDSLVPDWNTTAFEGKIELFKAEGNSTSGHFVYGKNIAVVDGKQAAELNADEPSTLYQYVNTESGSKYKWQLSHRGRAGSDIMALVIGPKQFDENGNVVDPAKTSKTGNDQFMAMIDWVKGNLEYYPEIASDIEVFEKEKGKKDNYKCTPIKMTVYSRPFAANGGFRDGLSTNFSPSESTVFTEKWDISLICTGYENWGTYGANDSERYSEYDVPEGQKESIFAFTGYHGTGTNGQKNPTFGNLLDGVNFKLYYPARSVSYTGGGAVLRYVYKGEPEKVNLESGQSTGSLWVDDNSTFTLDVKPDYATTTVTDEQGNVKTEIRKDANGYPIQNAFLGAYITIDGKREYYPATAVGEDQAVYFSETVAEDGTITYSYGKSNVSGRIVVELVFSEVYTMTYNSNGGEAYFVQKGKCEPQSNMDWSGSNANIARFYESVPCTYISTACEWWENNSGVDFKGWELVGGEIYEIKSEDEKTLLTDTKEVLFAGDAKVEHKVTDDENVFIITDTNNKYEGRVDAKTGGVLVANWEYVTSVIAQTEQLDGSFINSDVGGKVALKTCSMHITDDSGNVYTPPADPDDTNNIIDFTNEFTYSSEFNNNITVSGKANEHYTFYGWFDKDGERLSSITDHKYTVEPYYSDSDKSKRKQTPSVIYARFGISTKVKFHINDMDTVSTVGNPNADLFRVYYPSSVDVSKASATYKILNLDSNDRISEFYDIPKPVSNHGKIFKGWYLDKDNNADNNPIKWNYDEYTTNTDIYAHWIDVGTVDKDAQDNKIIHQSPGNSNKLPGIDLLGVQIRYEDEDENYPNGRGTGSGQALHFDTDGLRFITCIKEDILSQTNTLFKKTYSSYTKKSLRYGYVLAKETTAKDNLSNGETLEYKDSNVNGVDTTGKYSFVKNVDCTSKVGGYNTSTTILDHKNYSKYRIYSLVISYNTTGKTDAQIESAKNQNVVARPYLRYQDSNGLYRTYYQDYTGTKVYGGCSTNYKTTWDYLKGKGYFPEK